jgi:predicted acetyltransferase
VRLTEEDWPRVAEIYRRFSEGRTGYLVRSERWWKEGLFRRLYDEKRLPWDVAVWQDGRGAAGGYVSYASIRDPGPMGGSKVWLREFIALDRNAYAGLLRYVLSHDLADEINWYGPLDDPLALAVDDSERIKREYRDDFMLRVVDVEKAIAARPPGPGAPEGAFTIAISDASGPWNQGTWRIECTGGRLEAVRSGATAAIVTDAATFAALYDGFLKTTEAARAGLAEVGDRDAALLADRVLAVAYPPFASDFF